MEVIVLISDIGEWALGVGKSGTVPVPQWGRDPRYLSLRRRAAAWPSRVNLNQVRCENLLTFFVSLAGAHNEVFVAASYQLQEEGWYLIWHKIYQDKITLDFFFFNFTCISRIAWYQLSFSWLELSLLLIGTEHPETAVAISVNHSLQLLLLHTK